MVRGKPSKQRENGQDPVKLQREEENRESERSRRQTEQEEGPGPGQGTRRYGIQGERGRSQEGGPRNCRRRTGGGDASTVLIVSTK